MKEPSEDVAKILYNRGLACAGLRDFDGAFKSFRKAIAHNPNMAFAHPFCHIANNVNAVAFQSLAEVLLIVHEIKTLLIIASPKSLQSHYTNLEALKKLVVGENFRLYNADYMNDPEEGKIFWRIMKKLAGHDCYEAIHSDESEESHSPAYVGSFFRENRPAKSLVKKDGELFLWRTYGKHAGVEAAGACLYFGIQNFSDTPPLQFGRMHYPNQDARSAADSLEKECIYNVIYANKSYSTRNKKLRNPLQNLAQKLRHISTHKWSRRDKKNVYRMTRELLDDIRFLFKASHYRDEQESRIVRSHYTVEGAKSVKSAVKGGEQAGDVKIHDDNLLPRLYVEARGLDLQAVTLGPMVQDPRKWIPWLRLQKSDLKIHHSQIPYGQKT